MAECTGKPTSTIYEELTTVTAVPTETVTVVEEDEQESVVTTATGTTVDCPSATAGSNGDEEEDPTESSSTPDSHSTDGNGGLLGGLLGGDESDSGGLRRRGHRRLKRQRGDEQCTTRTLYATSTINGKAKRTSTIATTVDSTIVTSTPVSTLYADCTESDTPSSESSSSSESKTTSARSSSSSVSATSSSKSSKESSKERTEDESSSAGSASDESSADDSSVPASSTRHGHSSSKETDSSSKSGEQTTSWFTSTASDGHVTSGLRTIELSTSATGSSEPDEDESSVGTYIGAGIGGVVGLLMLLVLARFAYRWCHKERDDDLDDHGIQDWSVSAPHHSDPNSPAPIAGLASEASPRSLESFNTEETAAAAAAMKRSRSNTSSLERDLRMPPMQERPVESYYPGQNPQFYAYPTPYPEASSAMYAAAPVVPAPDFAASDERGTWSSRFSQATLGSNAAGFGAGDFGGPASGQTGSAPPPPPPPPPPPMIKETPPTEYSGSNRGSTVLLPRRSQLFDNSARAPELALAPAVPTYSYKDEPEMLNDGERGATAGSPRAAGGGGRLQVANPSAEDGS